MQRAEELRTKHTSDLQQNMRNLTNRVHAKLGMRSEQREADYMEIFKNNLEKRKKVEDKKKKRLEEQQAMAEFNMDRKQEKLQGIQARQKNNKDQLNKRN